MYHIVSHVPAFRPASRSRIAPYDHMLALVAVPKLIHARGDSRQHALKAPVADSNFSECVPAVELPFHSSANSSYLPYLALP